MKNKKMIGLLLAVILTAGVFTGCSSSDEGSSGGGGGNAVPVRPINEAEDAENFGGDYRSYELQEETGAAQHNFIYEQQLLPPGENGAFLEDDYYEYFSTEEYAQITESGYKSVAVSPLSTFSADVDTASYANVRRMIESGQSINPDAVRVEEMLNYFSYNYPKPTGPDPFSVTTELSDCPWNDEAKLMLIGLKGLELDINERPAMNTVFLIDVSGSMFSGDKLPLVQDSLNLLCDYLTEDDTISIVTYAGADRVVLQGESGENKNVIKEAVNSLSAGGATAGSAGITRAYEIAEKYFIQGGNNRIILCTDGDLNVGVSSEDELKKLVEKKREGGVYLSVLGFGTGNIKDNKMQTLADNGNGNYNYIDSIKEAKKVLVEEMTGTLFAIAKDVKIQVEFNPEYVKGYRLIGYEKRELAAKDFNDDTKDAGEIGAGHTVTALYELILTDHLGYDGIELKYQENTSVDPKAELCTVSLRYKSVLVEGDSKLLTHPVTAGSYLSELPENLKFASAVAMFGMVLRDSDNKGAASCDAILDLLGGAYSYDHRAINTVEIPSEYQYRAEFRYLVEMMKKAGF